MTSNAAILTIAFPALAACAGLLLARTRSAAVGVGVFGAAAALAAACVEAYQVAAHGPVERIALLGNVDLGLGNLDLAVRADGLAAAVALAVSLVAMCVQVYSSGYLHGPGTLTAPTRYRPYAATVSLFTASMMLVVHANDLILLLIGWEGMGICSYLLVGHHSERASARAAAVKAFLVTRVGDLGVVLAVVLLLVNTGTTSIPVLLARAGQLQHGVVVAATLLLLMGVVGKSAQFPLHTWLPDAMEGPTPVSALIHAATMVAAGVYLVARMLPLFLAAPISLEVAAVIAAITMLGAALAAFAQQDLKRLLAYSTISQVAYMLAGIAVVRTETAAGIAVFHLLSHAAFKALLFLLAGCVTHMVGSTLLKDMGGLRQVNRGLAVLLGLGLAALAGIPPLGGFWSKEAVLSAAEDAAKTDGGWTAWLVLVSGLLTALVTGVYAGRAFALVALGEPAPLADHGGGADPAGHGAGEHSSAHLPASMVWPLWLLAVPTLLFGLLLVRPPGLLAAVEVNPITAFTGSLVSIAGLVWAVSVTRFGAKDVADVLPVPLRDFLCAGYRLDAVQNALVVRPYRRLARLVSVGDYDVVDSYPRGSAVLTRWLGQALRLAQTGLATGYVVWVLLGAAVVGFAGVMLS